MALKLIATTTSLSKQGDVLILPVWEEGGPLVSFPSLDPLKEKDFVGKVGKTMLFFHNGQRILLTGLGKQEECNAAKVRLAFAAAVKRCVDMPWKTALFETFPKEMPGALALFRAAVEGVRLSAYSFDRYKQKKPTLFTEGIFKTPLAEAKEILRHTTLLFSGVDFARDAVNTNADEMSPNGFVVAIQKLAKECNFECRILRMKELEKEGLHLIQTVGRAAAEEPALAILTYKGGGKKTLALVGKGLTYDTGGLSLKQTESMLTMKDDMAGGAAVLGTLKALHALKAPVNVVALVGIAENAIDAKSYKVGDVYPSYLGKSVEIVNTDAEGRLVLADCLAYGIKHYKPDILVNIATLTGAMGISLGTERCGYFANHEPLAEALEKAAISSGEKIWRMPLDEEYAEALTSEIADIKHCGDRFAGSIVAAKFLEAFVDKGQPWAHLDIASVAFHSKPKGVFRSQATGFGVRLLTELCLQYAAS